MKVVIFTMALLFLVQNGCTTPADERGKAGFKYEEYRIEHEISSEQARNAVLSTNPKSIKSPPGCHECTPDEIRYCLGRELINDHCCCDFKYHELLPFIPHTCYIGKQFCKTVVSSCDEYRRLHSCCCQKHAFLKWKAKSESSTSRTKNNILFSSLLLLLLYYVNRSLFYVYT